MDSITQAVLGASIQGAMLGRHQGRRALLYGAALATLPDLDVVIAYADPVSAMTHHRGFSHSLLVLSAFSVLLAWLIRRWRPSPHYTATRLWLTLWLVLITHPLLDAFTSYGTQLLWPFAVTPTAWSSIFIIDPVYTVPLVIATLAGLAVGIRRGTLRLLHGALAFSCVYLAFTVGGKMVAEHRVRQALEAASIQPAAMFSGTAPLNSLLWRVMAKDGSGHYYESFVSLLDAEPARLTALPLGSELAGALAASPEHQRLRWFTDDWLRYDVVHNRLIVTDLRMGMAGHHFFRFVMAEHSPQGWQPVVPARWPGVRGGENELRMLWQRIWRQDPALPLQEWDAQMRDAAPAPP